jgi:hypothetical protein
LGNQPGLTNFVLGLDRFNGTGACTQFTLTRTTDDANALEVLVNSIQQDPISSYSVAAGLLTFTEAPSNGANNIVVIYRSTATISYTNITTAQIGDGQVTLSKLAAGVLPTANITAAFNTANAAFLQANTPSHVANSAAIYANGAFTAANSSVSAASSAGVYANGAFIQANTVFTQSNTYVWPTANSAAIYANGAFTAANTKAATASPTFTGTVVMANANTTVINVQSQLEVYGRAFQNIITLADVSTITMNLAQTNNFSVTLGGNRTLANVANSTPGQSGFIVVRQDGTGSRTLSFGTGWRFPTNSAPTLTTTANAVDLIVYTATTTSNVIAQALLSVT